jgi:hypothetical protein
MENDCGSALDLEKPWALWREAFGGNSQRPEYLQVISPYRGEEFGIDNLNRVLQESVHGEARGRVAPYRRHRSLRQGDPDQESPTLEPNLGPTALSGAKISVLPANWQFLGARTEF